MVFTSPLSVVSDVVWSTTRVVSWLMGPKGLPLIVPLEAYHSLSGITIRRIWSLDKKMLHSCDKLVHDEWDENGGAAISIEMVVCFYL